MTHPDLHPKNHELFAAVHEAVKKPVPLEQIARELGFDVGELVAWIMDYKAPRKPKEYVNRMSAPKITWRGNPFGDLSVRENAARFERWLRAEEDRLDRVERLRRREAAR